MMNDFKFDFDNGMFGIDPSIKAVNTPFEKSDVIEKTIEYSDLSVDVDKPLSVERESVTRVVRIKPLERDDRHVDVGTSIRKDISKEV